MRADPDPPTGADDATITDTLARRSDLTPNRAQRVLRIVEQLAETGGAAAKSGEAQSLARQARQQRFEVKLLLSDLTAKVREVDDVLIMLADEDRAYHLAQVLAQIAGITTEHGAIRHALNLESVITYEGTETVHQLVIGREVTGINAF